VGSFWKDSHQGSGIAQSRAGDAARAPPGVERRWGRSQGPEESSPPWRIRGQASAQTVGAARRRRVLSERVGCAAFLECSLHGRRCRVSKALPPQPVGDRGTRGRRRQAWEPSVVCACWSRARVAAAREGLSRPCRRLRGRAWSLPRLTGGLAPGGLLLRSHLHWCACAVSLSGPRVVGVAWCRRRCCHCPRRKARDPESGWPRRRGPSPERRCALEAKLALDRPRRRRGLCSGVLLAW